MEENVSLDFMQGDAKYRVSTNALCRDATLRVLNTIKTFPTFTAYYNDEQLLHL